MPDLSGNEWKVLCYILRRTRGWHKTSERISYRQIAPGTGIASHTTIQKALTELSRKGHIIAHKGENGETSTYELNLAFEIEVERRVTEAVTPNGNVATESGTRGVTKTVAPQAGNISSVKTSPSDVTESVTHKKQTIQNTNREKNNFGTASQAGQKRAASSAKSKELDLSDPITRAILEVCNLDSTLISQQVKFEVITASDAFKSDAFKSKYGSEYSLRVIAEEIERFKAWWYEMFWKGKNGQTPSPTEIRDRWGQYQSACQKEPERLWEYDYTR